MVTLLPASATTSFCPHHHLLLFSDLIVLAGQLSDAGDCPLRYLDEIAIDEMYDNFPLF